MIRSIVAACLIAVTGCTAPDVQPDDAQQIYSGRLVRAVSIGWNRVDPAAYQGWDGELPDCEVDAEIWAGVWSEAGIPTTMLLTEEATRDACKAALKTASTGMQLDDLLIVCTSGHGGQKRDLDGDETSDALDEYVCAYDGPITDDTINDWLCAVAPGVRILWICDTCNAGTMHRAGPPVRLAQRAVRDMLAQLILLAGCDEGRSSESTGSGGRWTTALFDSGPADLSPRSWFDSAVTLVPADVQVPIYVEYGPVSYEFRNGSILP